MGNDSSNLDLVVGINDQTQAGLRKISDNAKKELGKIFPTPSGAGEGKFSDVTGPGKSKISKLPGIGEKYKGEEYKNRKEGRKQRIEEKHRKIKEGGVSAARTGVQQGEGIGSFIANPDMARGLNLGLEKLDKFSQLIGSKRKKPPGISGGMQDQLDPGIRPSGSGGKSEIKVNSAIININKGQIGKGAKAIPGIGIGAGGTGVPGVSQPGRRPPPGRRSLSPVRGGGLIGKIGQAISPAALGLGAAIGIPLAIMSAYSGLAKGYVGGQLPTTAMFGKTSSLKGAGLSGVGLSASARAQAIQQTQMGLTGQFKISGLGKGNKAYSDANRWQGQIAKAVQFSTAQGMGAQAGVTMFTQIQNIGRYKSKKEINRDLGILAGYGTQSGVGFRQRGKLAAGILDIVQQSRESGGRAGIRGAGRMMTGLTTDSKNIANLAHAQKVTSTMSTQMSSGFSGGGLGSIIAMQAMQADPNMSMVDIMKKSEEGMTTENIGLLQKSGLFKGDMGTILLSHMAGLKTREAEAVVKGIQGGYKVKEKDLSRSKKWSKEIGWQKKKATAAEDISLFDERRGQSAVAQKSLQMQMKLMGVMHSLVTGIDGLISKIKKIT